MSKTAVRCSQCGKLLFYSDTPANNRGRIAAECQRKGFVAKLPCFFGHSRFEYFCDKECKDKWFAAIPQDIKEEGNKAVAQLSERMKSDDFQRGLQEGLARISDIYDKLKERLK